MNENHFSPNSSKPGKKTFTQKEIRETVDFLNSFPEVAPVRKFILAAVFSWGIAAFLTCIISIVFFSGNSSSVENTAIQYQSGTGEMLLQSLLIVLICLPFPLMALVCNRILFRTATLLQVIPSNKRIPEPILYSWGYIIPFVQLLWVPFIAVRTSKAISILNGKLRNTSLPPSRWVTLFLFLGILFFSLALVACICLPDSSGLTPWLFYGTIGSFMCMFTAFFFYCLPLNQLIDDINMLKVVYSKLEEIYRDSALKNSDPGKSGDRS